MGGTPAAIETDVAILGCGPVGALAANLLGLHGVRAVVLERDAAPHGMPRAVSCDDESARTFQHIGLAERILGDMRKGEELRFTNGADQTFAEVDLRGNDFGLGYGQLYFYHQPTLEQALREGAVRSGVPLHLGVEVQALVEERDHILISAAGLRVRARYALACDGARSTARHLAHIDLEGTRSEPWLTVTVRLGPGQPPPATRFVCDPRRPHFVCVLPQGLVRFEIMLLPGEDPSTMERPETFRALLARHLDPDQATLLRAAVYTFRDAVARTWRRGRLLLLGDAAHQMPPFMGQGLCSGFRDALNLTWKLALVLRGAASPSLLDSYEIERRPHVEEMAGVSRALGRIFMARDARAAFARDHLFALLDRIPRARRFIRGSEFKPLPAFERGLVAGGKRSSRRAPEGTMLIQPRVLRSTGGPPILLDEALGKGFAILGFGADPRALVPPSSRSFWEALGTTFLHVAPHDGGGGGDVIDVTGKLQGWFERAGATYAIVRPDRFVFAAFDGPRASAMTDELRAALG